MNNSPKRDLVPNGLSALASLITCVVFLLLPWNNAMLKWIAVGMNAFSFAFNLLCVWVIVKLNAAK